MSLALAVSAFGLGHAEYDGHHDLDRPLYIMPDGPGDGWGFPNGAPDGYGWVDHGVYLPLGRNRTPEYFFPRYFAAVPGRCFRGPTTIVSRLAASGIYLMLGAGGAPDGRAADCVVALARFAVHGQPRRCTPGGGAEAERRD